MSLATPLLRPVRFGRPENRLVFDRAKLDMPLPMGDDVAHRLARAQCDLALGTFAGTVVERVRRLLSTSENLRSLGEVAGELRLSPRTLKRRLSEHGTTFKELSENARRERAVVFLRSGLSVSETSRRVGYTAPQNFVRAFRSWTNLPPSVYRRSSHAQEK